jgi:hypothetical protein
MERALGLESVVVRSSEPVSTDMDGEIVMMSIQQGRYFALDAVASSVWSLLEKPRSVGALVAELLQQFEIDGETCAHDTLAFLEVLRERKLLDVL